MMHGLGILHEGVAGRADGIAKGAEDILKVVEGAEKTSSVIGDIGEGVLKFFSFGAADIVAPMVLTSKTKNPKQISVTGLKPFLAAIAQGYESIDDQWIYLGLKPPKGVGKTGQVWDGISGRWVGAGQAPTDTTTPTSKNPTQVALAQQSTNAAMSVMGVDLWNTGLAYAASLVASGQYQQAQMLEGYGKPGLVSMIRGLGIPWTRLATTMGMRATTGPQVGRSFAEYNASRVARLVALVTRIPAGQRPPNAAALAAMADPDSLPTLPGPGLPVIPVAGVSPVVGIAVAGLLFLAMRALG